jgi:uncharacterized membrane protein (DUF373 family)
MVKIIVTLILWFFIINGAIIVSKICLWGMRQHDITYTVTGGGIMIALWLFLVIEIRKTIKKYIKND